MHRRVRLWQTKEDTLWVMFITQRSLRRYFFVLLIISTILSVVFGVSAPAFAQAPGASALEVTSELSKEEQAELFKSLPPQIFSEGEEIASVPGAVDCFDYYSFGSVEVDVAPTLEQTIPGTPFTFTGKVKNNNAYPIVDGQVYVKIFKHDESSEDLVKENGYPLVAFFLAKDNVVLKANTEQSITFDWQVPEALSGGTYTAALFFTTAHRYNLLGLSFTDDVTGNKATFEVTPLAVSNAPVAWNKHGVLLNDTKFRFASFPPHFSKDESVTAHMELENPSNESRDVEVTIITSKWDGILDAHEIGRESKKYSLKPNQTLEIPYTPAIADTSVTFLQAIVKDRDAESIMHIRFVRDGNEEARINFPSVLKYPFKAGETNMVFSCVHSTNLPIVRDNVLTLTLKDKNEAVIHTYTYTGDITGSMMGLKDTFTPDKDISTFFLTASLSHNGTIVDEVTQKYDCNEIDPALCVPDTIAEVFAEKTGTSTPLSTTLYIIIFALVILIALGTFVMLRRKKVESTIPVTTPEPYDTNI